MAINRSKKNKKNPHYGFLVSWSPSTAKSAAVKRESKIAKDVKTGSSRHSKNADSLAQAEASRIAKADLRRSLIHISLVLILELMVYLAWKRFLS